MRTTNKQQDKMFNINKCTLPSHWKSNEGMIEFMDQLQESWENNCPVSQKLLQLEEVTTFDTDGEGYHRFLFKNKRKIRLTTIRNNMDVIREELNHLLDNDGASIEPNYWFMTKCKDTTEILILMAWSE